MVQTEELALLGTVTVEEVFILGKFTRDFSAQVECFEFFVGPSHRLGVGKVGSQHRPLVSGG